MAFIDLVLRRESCRNFSSKKVEKEKLISCIESARLSPSACNSQPWSFIVVNSNEVSSKLAKCTQDIGMNKFTDKCPAFIVVCEEKANLSAKLGGLVKSQKYAPIDIGIAIAHICYGAVDLGLSTCILGWFSQRKVTELLNLEKGKKISIIIAIGYSNDDKLHQKSRKSIDEIMTYID